MKNKALHKTAPDTHILTIVGLMVLALILMAILQPGNYFTLKNAKSMIFQFPEYGILAFGMMVCMIAGGIDLSLVGIMNFTGVLAAMIVTKMTEGGEGMAISAILVAIVTALVVGGCLWCFQRIYHRIFQYSGHAGNALRTAALHRSCLWNYRRSGNQRYV